MKLIPTDDWLTAHYERPMELCSKLSPYFDGAPAGQIYQHLTFHGLYPYPQGTGQQAADSLQQLKAGDIGGRLLRQLQREWNGPSIPVFILPAQNKKSGLAFKDKLFIFLPPNCRTEEIRAVITHEYHHVCRLSKSLKQEKDFSLLDVMIMEGLAEHAVREKVGAGWLADWTQLYSDSVLQYWWNTVFLPNRDTPAHSPKFSQLLYGTEHFRKLGGYAAGYYAVNRYMESSPLTAAGLLAVSANEIIRSVT